METEGIFSMKSYVIHQRVRSRDLFDLKTFVQQGKTIGEILHAGPAAVPACSIEYAKSVLITAERKLYEVTCDAALVDLHPLTAKHSGLIHKTDYSYTHSVGARLHREGHPGLVTASVRDSAGQNFVILNPDILSNPRHYCQLTYRLEADHISIEKQPGVVWMEIATIAL